MNINEYLSQLTDRGYISAQEDSRLVTKEMPKLIAALKLVDEAAKCGKAAFCADCVWCNLRKDISEILGVKE